MIIIKEEEKVGLYSHMTSESATFKMQFKPLTSAWESQVSFTGLEILVPQLWGKAQESV